MGNRQNGTHGVEMTAERSSSCRRKAVLVTPLPPPYGGIANWAKIVVAALDGDADWETTIVDISPRQRATEGRSLLNRVNDGLKSTVKARKALRRAVREGTSIVHITTSGSLALFRDGVLLSYLAKCDIPTVYHIHFGRVPNILNGDSWEKAALLRNLSLCTKVIAMDSVTAKTLESAIGKDKVELAGNPIELAGMDSISCEMKEEEKEVVYIGWLVPTKGIVELCEAWRHIYKEYSDWHLKLIGPYEPAMLKKMIGGVDDGIEIIGELPHDVAMRQLATAAIAVLPSYTEGYPNFVLEAMSLGRPVVATTVGAIPEMLGEERGILVPPRDAEALRYALESLMADSVKRRDLGLRAKRFAHENCGSEVVVNKYKKVWLKAIGERNG